MVTVHSRTLHLLQSPEERVYLTEKESAPCRRRLGMDRFRSKEAERLKCDRVNLARKRKHFLS